MQPSPESAYLQRLLDERESLRALAMRLVRDVARADDVVQETLLVALERRPPGSAPLRAWLAGVARNVALHLSRGERRRSRREQQARRPGPGAGSDELAARVEGQRRLAQAVLELAEPFRSAVMLRYFDDLQPAQIAQQLGVPASTVRGRLERGLARLRERLESEYGSDRDLALALLPLALPGPTPGAPPLPDPTAAASPGATTPSATLIMGTSTQLAVALTGVTALLSVAFYLSRPQGPAQPAHQPATPVAQGLAEMDPLPERDAPRSVAGTSGGPEASGATASQPARELAPADPRIDLLACCIVGRITDGAGQPLAGVRVEGRDDRPLNSSFVSGDERHALSVSATTDEDGVYRVEVPASRPVLLSVDHEPYAIATARTCFAGGRRDFVLTDGVRLAVRVEAESGEPVSGAALHLRPDSPSSVMHAWGHSARTDEEGRARFERLPLERLNLTATAAGYAIADVRFEPERAGALERVVVLEPAATVVGRVVDGETGLGIPGASVDLAGGRGVTADAEGHFRIGGFRPAPNTTHGVRASAPGYGVDVRYTKLTSAGEAPPITIRLSAGAIARGRVTDERANPIAGARVLCRTSYSTNPFVGESRLDETFSGPDGRFQLVGLRRDARHQILAYAPGFGACACEFVVVPGDVVTELGAFALSAAGSILGRVSGTPGEIKAHLVVLEALFGEGPAARGVPIDQSLTAPDGSFAIDGLSAGFYRLQVFLWNAQEEEHEERPIAARSLVLGPGERRSVGPIGLEPNLDGHVRDAEGQALSGILVEARSVQADGAPPQAMARTDLEGRFALAVEGDGPFLVQVSDPRTFYEPDERARVLAGERLEFRLALSSLPHTIAGLIRLEDGSPVEGTYVHFTHVETGHKLSMVGISDEHGRFEVPNLRPGHYDLRHVDFDGRYEPAVLLGVDATQSPVVELVLRPRE